MTTPQTMTEAVAHGIQLVEQLLAGSMSVDVFLTAFGDLYDVWAMDGHESDTAGLELLASTSTSVAILGRVSSTIGTLFPEHEEEGPYLAAGRLPLRAFLPTVRDLVTAEELARARIELRGAVLARST